MPLTSKDTLVRLDSSLDLNKDDLSKLLNIEKTHLFIEKSEILQPTLKRNYRQRFHMLCLGATFLLKELPKQSMEEKNKLFLLKTYINELGEEYEKTLLGIEDDTDINAFQAKLHEYTCLLVAATAHQLGYGVSHTVKILAKAEEYVTLLQGRPDLATISPLTIDGKRYLLTQREIKISPLSEELKNQYWQIKQQSGVLPDWYTKMDPLEQRFLRHILDKAKLKSDLDEVFANYSSRLRTLPGPANYRKHRYELAQFNDEGNLTIIASGTRHASSMISSRDVLHLSQAVRDFYTSHNLERLIDELEMSLADYLKDNEVSEGDEIKIPLLLQTLITPLIQPDGSLIHDKEKAIEDALKKDYSLEKKVINREGVEVTIKIIPVLISTNHPLNLGRYINYTKEADSHCQNFIGQVNKYLSEKTISAEKEYEIKALLQEYNDLLKQDSLPDATWNDINARELYLSSLEQLLMVRIGGLAYGSCVSAKDRKGLEFIHTDTIELYRHLYQKWPSYKDSGIERKQFDALFALIYTTRHHHVSAGQNALGAEGIKTPAMYLPKNIRSAIEAIYQEKLPALKGEIFNIDDRLASNNELRSIIKSGDWFPYPWTYYEKRVFERLLALKSELAPVAVSVDETKMSPEIPFADIYTKIAQILNARRFWQQNTSFQWVSFFSAGSPKGIERMRLLLNKAPEDRDMDILTRLEVIARNRGASHYLRFESTNTFYEIIEKLHFSIDDVRVFQQALKNLNAFHHEVMKFEGLPYEEKAEAEFKR